MNWFKKLFAAPKPEADEAAEFDVNTATLEELNIANMALGREIDAIRDKRKVLKARIDALHLLRDMPAQGEA